MPEAKTQQVTRLLEGVRDGREGAAAALLDVVYDELRRIAGAQMARVPPGDTLEPTALVHEAYLRLVDMRQKSTELRNTIVTVLSTTACVVCWWSFTGFDSHDVTGLGLVIEMQLDTTSL